MPSVNMPTLAPVSTKSNIFSAPLKSREEAEALARKKEMRMGLAKLSVAVVGLAAYSFFFFYPQLVDYLGFGKALAARQAEQVNLQDSIDTMEDDRIELKSAYEKKNQEEQAIVEAVLPSDTDKIGVIRLMENFATNLNAAYPPFEFNSVSFQNPVKEKAYVRLPFSTSIRTTRANLERFLELVRISGDIDPEAKDHIRLMDISNITISYLGTDSTGRDLGVQFTVQMNAYSRPAETTKAPKK